jgi:ABC-2 type transport system ATP-binding protein
MEDSGMTGRPAVRRAGDRESGGMTATSSPAPVEASTAESSTVEASTVEASPVGAGPAISGRGPLAPDAAHAIRARGLHKSYGPVTALRGVDLDVAPGEVLALLGPNGAGKTTTLDILTGYRRPDAGTVLVLGTGPDVRGRAGRRWRARIGIVAQAGTGVPDLSLTAILAHFGGYYPDPLPPARALALTGLDSQADRRPGQLSGGQRRRLDVALGLVGRPELLFLDEPTTGFDPDARRRFWALLRGLAHQGTTIVLTTHYLEEAEVLADRIAVIRAGQVIETGPPATLGGRERAAVTVSWRAAGRLRTLRTHEPTAVISSLARRHHGEIPGLSVTRPTLEDVYLTMIGAV